MATALGDFPFGQSLYLKNTLTDATGAAILVGSITTLTLTLDPPTGAQLSRTLAAGQITNPGTNVYQYRLQAADQSVVGTWWARWVAVLSNGDQIINEGWFRLTATSLTP